MQTDKQTAISDIQRIAELLADKVDLARRQGHIEMKDIALFELPLRTVERTFDRLALEAKIAKPVKGANGDGSGPRGIRHQDVDAVVDLSGGARAELKVRIYIDEERIQKHASVECVSITMDPVTYYASRSGTDATNATIVVDGQRISVDLCNGNFEAIRRALGDRPAN